MNEKKHSYQKNNKKKLKRFEEIFLLFYPRLRKYAFNLLNNQNEAEDLVQDVFFQVWQNIHELDDEKNVGSYLFTLLRNKCLNSLKHKIIEEKYIVQSAKNGAEELYHISFSETEKFTSMEKRLMTELEKIISEMPEKCQTAFRLKWFEGKKIREIAAIMKISATMVDKHLARGLEIARKKLNPDLYIFFLMLCKED
ncbi:MAG: RNA polymerase sigma-70 factor [Mariniphaga sp.]|jgi:RNA polymerase sigma-70 factor (ECF subfamily)|nr:RNA polymerase sigma-70 factor [Mariniphaga sp.]